MTIPVYPNACAARINRYILLAMAKLALAGLFCFMLGAAWIAILFAEAVRTEDVGVVIAPRAAELLCVLGFALLAAVGVFALVKTIRRRFNA